MTEEWIDVVKSQKAYERLGHEAKDLERLLEDIVKQQHIVRTAKHHLDRADRDLRELEALRNTIIDVDRKYNDLSRLIGDIERLGLERAEVLEELMYAENDYKRALGKRCPLCGRI